MAKVYFGINRQDPVYAATVSASTTGKEIEITVDPAAVPRADLIAKVGMLQDFILQGNYPPM